MMLIDYIKELTFLLNEHGNLRVKTRGVNIVNDAPLPKIKHMRILQGKERNPNYFHSMIDEPSQQGEKVIGI